MRVLCFCRGEEGLKGIVEKSCRGSWDFSLEERGKWGGGCEWVLGGS